MCPRDEYERRLAGWRERIAALDRRHLLLSNARLLTAALIAVLLWLAFIRVSIAPAWVPAGLAGFVALAFVHAHVLQRAERGRRAARLYERGIDRLDGRWAGAGRTGDQFLEDHSYARDLDLFGRASLFELLNTARTEAGEAALAAWLRSGASLDEVRARQAAVEELRGNLAFREDLAVLAAESEVSRTGALARWARTAPIGFSAAARVVLWACSMIAIALTAAALQRLVPWVIALTWLFVEYAATWPWRRRLETVHHRVGKPATDLALLAGVIVRIEREPMTSPCLTALQASLAAGREKASRAIERLTQLVSLYESTTHNLLFVPFTRALLIPEQLAIAIDRWHAAHGPTVDRWLQAVGELEALSALATYAYEHPADPFPDLEGGGAVFAAEGLGHPLMPDAASVRNDVHIGVDNPRVIVVSGSNMSGKSTLLRSVGVNVVLALAGAPVRAARLRLSALVLGATLRIDDSLQEGHSRFYTEILRLRAIVDAARGPTPLLCLLDEILHGTNSYDRRVGAEAIVRALVEAGAIGLVTTHDLALTELPSRLGPAAVNMHFEDRIEDGRMIFDYRMRPGVVEHSNALALMRAIGLDV